MELNSGTIDCVWNGFTANCADDDGVQRADKVDFSYYYMTNTQCIIRLNQTAALTSVSQFEGTSVAYENGSAGHSYIESVTLDKNGDTIIDINAKGVTSQADAVREVNAGTAQYAVVDILLAQSLAGQGDFANLTINVGIEIPEEYYAIGFKKGSELTAKVNEKLLAYESNGYLASLAKKYNLSSKLIPINK
jgi:polar amino acid transport system substrate-binding protein